MASENNSPTNQEVRTSPSCNDTCMHSVSLALKAVVSLTVQSSLSRNFDQGLGRQSITIDIADKYYKIEQIEEKKHSCELIAWFVHSHVRSWIRDNQGSHRLQSRFSGFDSIQCRGSRGSRGSRGLAMGKRTTVCSRSVWFLKRLWSGIHSQTSCEIRQQKIRIHGLSESALSASGDQNTNENMQIKRVAPIRNPECQLSCSENRRNPYAIVLWKRATDCMFVTHCPW